MQLINTGEDKVALGDIWMVHTHVVGVPNSVQGPFLFKLKEDAVSFCLALGAVKQIPWCSGKDCSLNNPAFDVLKYRGNIRVKPTKELSEQDTQLYATVTRGCVTPPAEEIMWWESLDA